ncbi:MAG: DUF4332 domain-containing protein [Candidatus Bathyarchaeota archaeon]|nr:MAG: DUF4332 domain-containing protein [Candidatus Bathyarchaeota archaeon]
MKGTTFWIMGFFSFLAGLNAVNGIFMWVQRSPESIITPYLIGDVTGGLSVATYLWISILATFIFLGLTMTSIAGKLPDSTLVENVMEKVNGLQSDQEVIEKIRARLMIIDATQNEIRRDFSESFTAQKENGKMIRGDLLTKFDKQLAYLNEKMTKQLRKVEKTVQKTDQTSQKRITAITKQMKEVADLKLHVENLEKELMRPKPRLTSQSDLKEVKGIGTHLATNMKGIGVTNVGELILTDPRTIAEKTNTSQKTIERLQGRAQLSMLPGLKEKDVALLEELDITTRKQLADQDSIELGMKMNGILKTHVEQGKIAETEKPTIEDIDSWIKCAKS